MQKRLNPKETILFDLDGTLLPWDTQVLFCNWILKKQPWRRSYFYLILLLMPWARVLGGIAFGKRCFLSFLWGINPQKLEVWAEEFAKHYFPTECYDEVWRILQKYRNENKIIILSSASPEAWIKAIGKQIGADYVFGTKLAWHRVGFIPFFPEGSHKGKNKVRKLEAIFGKETWESKAVYGYSDSSADLPLLNLCKSACLIHPKLSWEKVGAAKGWKILTPSHKTKPHTFKFLWASFRQTLGIYSLKK